MVNIKLYHIVIFMLNLTIVLAVFLKLFKNRGMASILQNLFVRALNPESVRSLKIVISHASLYLGIILYTAVGAKVMVMIDRSGNWTFLDDDCVLIRLKMKGRRIFCDIASI